MIRASSSFSILSDGYPSANFRYRTPICVLFSADVIAATSYILCLHWSTPEVPLQHLVQGEQAVSILDAFRVHKPDQADQISGTSNPTILTLLINHLTNLYKSAFRGLGPYARLLQQHPAACS